METNEIDFAHLLKELTDIALALSSEKNHARLMALIIKKAKELTHADGGTLYSRYDENNLKFEIIMSDSLNLKIDKHSSDQSEPVLIPLHDKEGNPNLHMVSSAAVIGRKTVVIEDSYTDKHYDFSGTHEFDKKHKYRSQSFLSVPMINHLNEVIGVLQVINAIDKNTGKIVAFTKLDQQVVESLASQAAVAITKQDLINAQKFLFDALIQLIAGAIDEKSPYTAGHCRRVPILTKMIADAACRTNTGPLKDFKMTPDEKYELQVAAWLHDCGKITTPEYIVDKATKLETIFDKIDLVDTRFEVLKRDAMIEALQQKLKELTNDKFIPEEDGSLQNQLHQLQEWREVIRKCNIGGEYLNDETIVIIEKIAQLTWVAPSGATTPLLSADETECLKIRRGTLSTREREIINHHVTVTRKMLESLPYPKGLENVPRYASAHHEKINGTGYPQGLKGDSLPMQARIIAIADVYEALTANDRPYKKAMPITQALDILKKMKEEEHIDAELFDLFMKEKIYMKYGNYLRDSSDAK